MACAPGFRRGPGRASYGARRRQDRQSDRLQPQAESDQSAPPRDEEEYFEDIPAGHVTKDMIELAKHIVQTKSGHFHPEKFEDHYEEALKELLRKKQSGLNAGLAPGARIGRLPWNHVAKDS